MTRHPARVLSWIVVAVLFADPVSAQETYDQEMARLTAGMPVDVADYIPRLIGCIHWGGEYGGDETPPERVKQINDATAELKCDSIEAEGKALDARYKSNAAVVQRLKEVRGDYGAE